MKRVQAQKTIKMRKAERQTKVSKKYLSGMSQQGIAEDLNVTQATISRDLKELSKKWESESIKNITTLKEMELKRLDELEAQAAEQYELTREAKWLDIRLKAMDRRTKLIGLDAIIESKMQMEADINHGGTIAINLDYGDCGED